MNDPERAPQDEAEVSVPVPHPTPTVPPAPLLLHAFPSFAIGGAQVRFITLANRFGPRFRHAIVAMDGNLAARARLDPALDVSFPTLGRPGNTLDNARAIRRLLRTLRPDLLVTSNWGTIEWAIANRAGTVPHIHTEDGFGPDERHRQLPRRVWMRRLFLAGRTVVVPSRTLERIATRTWRLAPARVRYVPNGVDLDRFAPTARFAPIAPQPPAIPPLIGTVAVLRAEKNVGRLLRALALLPRGTARLLVVGDGPERPALHALAAALGVAGAVEWAGYVADPAGLLRSLDLFALSSDTEQMPLSLLEAMAAGLPAACTDVGDVSAILPPEQRPFIVPPDEAALARALAGLAADPALRRTLGAANRARVEAEFDQCTMFGAWERLYAAA